MAKFIEVQVLGVPQQMKRMIRIEQRIKDVDLGPAVRRVAAVWARNFDSEGGAVGGWAPLGPATQRVRAYRGYHPEHPILVQSGGLRQVAIGMPAAWSGRGNGYMGVRGVTGFIGKGLNRVTLEASGEKVQNQFGGSGSAVGSGMFRPGPSNWNLPARPFWFVDASVEREAYYGVEESVERIIREES